MSTPFKTRITELYGIRLPVIASGLMWLADPGYVAAVARAGQIGFMTSASFPDPAALRAGIRRCRELAEGKPFGVNIMIRANRDGSDRVTPLIAAGGIGTGAQLVAALALGADGVAMGTRLLVSEEIWAHRHYKERLVAAGETDTTLLLQSMRNTQRALKTEHVAMIQQLESDHADTQTLLPHIMGTHARKAYETGEYEKGLLSCGQGVVFADCIEPVAAIFSRIEAEAREAMQRLTSLQSNDTGTST